MAALQFSAYKASEPYLARPDGGVSSYMERDVMHGKYWLEQCVKRFLELGCPIPVTIETIVACEGKVAEALSDQRLDEVNVWPDSSDWFATSDASA